MRRGIACPREGLRELQRSRPGNADLSECAERIGAGATARFTGPAVVEGATTAPKCRDRTREPTDHDRGDFRAGRVRIRGCGPGCVAVPPWSEVVVVVGGDRPCARLSFSVDRIWASQSESPPADFRVRSAGPGQHSGGVFRVGEILIDPDRKSTRLNSSHLGISYAVF